MIEFESIQNHNNINQTGLKRRLVTIIDGELGADDIKFLKFLCQDHIAQKTLEKIKDGIQIFNELERLGKINTSRGEVDYLLESLCRCHRMDLIRKMGFSQIQVEHRVKSIRSNFSPFRLLLFELAEEMETADYKKALLTLSPLIPPWKHDKIKSICDVFIQLQRSGDLYSADIEVLYKLLKKMDRGDLISKVRAYQGAQPTGGNTKLGVGPPEEGQVYVPRTIESKEPEYQGAQPTGGNTKLGVGPPEEGQVFVPRTIESKEPEYQGEGQIPPANTVEQHRPTQATEHPVQLTGNQLSLQLEQFQNLTASVNPRVYSIPGFIPSQREPVDIQSLKYQQNPVFLGLQQEQPSPGTNPSVRGVGNQTPTEPSPFHRTGRISEVPVNHLVPRNDVITEEQSPGDSGLTAGTVTLLDRSSQDIRSGDIPLSITESKLVGLSKVIARRDDCFSLASALMIDYDQTSQIMQANPTNVLTVHGFLKHWFIEQRNRSGTSPTADALLKAFEQLGFTDAIEEYARLSCEPEAELEQGSENLAVSSEVLCWNQEQNFNVSSGFDPLINQRIRQPNRQDAVIVKQMEAVAIDDSAMPFYKMNAYPRGLAIIINNEYFHKIGNDQSSKEMPTRTGTEKDEEKLDYIWRKLGFVVQIYNNVDSTGMNKIMEETAFQDHSMYDCLVVSILTHGILGHVYGADGRIVRISKLTSCVSGRRCPSLAGKPKLFFIQACQGTEKQEGHAIETDADVSMPDERQDINVDRPRELIPDEADFLLGYATVPGYVSYRSRTQGSWYIRALAVNLDRYANKHDLLSILIKVNDEVGKATYGNGDYKQIPAPMITLRKRIIFR